MEESKKVKSKITLYENDLYSHEESVSKVRQIVCFSLDHEWYGIPIDSVKEVVAQTEVTALPFVPEHILGVINLRGGIISVSDLKVLFGLSGKALEEAHSFIVIKCGELETALCVEGNVEVVDILVSDFESLSVSLEGEKEKFLESQVYYEEKLIGILDAEKILEKTKA